MDSGKPMVDAAFGEVMVTCEKIAWLIREGEKYLRPERRSPGAMVGCQALLARHMVQNLLSRAKSQFISSWKTSQMDLCAA